MWNSAQEYHRLSTPVLQEAVDKKYHRLDGIRRTVSRVLWSSALTGEADGHSSGTHVAVRLARSTRAARSGNGPCKACRPYSILLLAGFAVPPPLPEVRCALAAPFHPCLRYGRRRRSAFCGTFPGVAPAGCYPAPCFRGARTFLPSPALLVEGQGERRPSVRLIPETIR